MIAVMQMATTHEYGRASRVRESQSESECGAPPCRSENIARPRRCLRFRHEEPVRRERYMHECCSRTALTRHLHAPSQASTRCRVARRLKNPVIDAATACSADNVPVAQRLSERPLSIRTLAPPLTVTRQSPNLSLHVHDVSSNSAAAFKTPVVIAGRMYPAVPAVSRLLGLLLKLK